jgi:arylsulfatase A-like enzyme
MLTATDDAIGAVVAAVEKAGLSDDTLFIFSSDNGGPDPGRITDNGDYRGGKGGLYEGGVRVAGFATWNGRIPAGSTVTEPMHIVDWRPTLQKLCSAAATGELPMDGLDVWSTLTAGAPSPHDAILLNTTPEDGAVRSGDWKLIVRRRAPRGRRKAARGRGEPAVELFNVRNDPQEATNLANAHPEKVKELRQRLAAFANEAMPPKSTPAPKSFEVPKVWGEAG